MEFVCVLGRCSEIVEWDWGIYIGREEEGGSFERWAHGGSGGGRSRRWEIRREPWKSKNQMVVWEKRDKVGPTTRRHGLK